MNVENSWRSLAAGLMISLFLLAGSWAQIETPSFTGLSLHDLETQSTSWTNSRSILVRLDGVSGNPRKVEMGDTPDMTGAVIKWMTELSYAQVMSFALDSHGAMTIDFSPDGSKILLATSNQTATIWDAWQGTLTLTLSGHEGNVNQARFSPDGLFILTGSSDTTARLWYAQAGEPFHTLSGHAGPVNAVAFSADSHKVVTGGDDNVAMVWDVATGARLLTLAGHTGSILSVAFSHDGQYVLTGSADDTMILWDAGSGEMIRSYHKTQDSDVRTVAFHPDDSLLVSGDADKNVLLWDEDTEDGVGKDLYATSGRANTAEYSPDGKFLLSCGTDGYLKVYRMRWDHVEGSKIILVHYCCDTVGAFSEDSRYIASTATDNTVLIHDIGPTYNFDLAEGDDGERTVYVRLTHNDLFGDTLQATIYLDTTPPMTPAAPVFSSDNPYTTDTAIRFNWDPVTDSASGVASYDCQISTGRNTGNIFDANVSLALEQAITGKEGWTYYCRVRARDIAGNTGEWSEWSDGLAIISGKAPVLGSVELLDNSLAAGGMGDFQWLLALNGVENEPLWVDVSESADFSSATTYDFGDFAGLNPLQTFTGHTNTINQVVISPDGSSILSGSKDGTIRLWSTQTGQQTRKLGPIDGGIRTVSFKPDGTNFFGGGYQFLTTGIQHNYGQIWRTDSGALRLTLSSVPEGDINSVAFSPDGSKLLIGKKVYSEYSGWLSLLNAETGEAIWPDIKLDRSPTKVAFSRDGTRLYACLSNNQLGIYDAVSGTLIEFICGESQGLPIAVSPDESEFTTYAYPMYAPVVRNLTDGLRLSDYPDGVSRYNAVDFNHDGTLLVAGEEGGPSIWDKRTGVCIRRYSGHAGGVLKLANDPTGTRLVTAASDNSIILWDARPAYIYTPTGHPGVVKNLYVRLRNHSGSSPVVRQSYLWTVLGYNAVRHDYDLYQ